MPYTLPQLPYAYDSLEPYIDEKTMQVHHNGHHKAYVDKLNLVLSDYPQWQLPIDDLLTKLDQLPTEIRTEVKNNGGGHANHSLFWTTLKPHENKSPEGDLATILRANFGSFEGFQEKFAQMATEHFSNGWAWLSVDKKHQLKLHTTPDHESPVSQYLQPLLVLDLWEHAYYLKNQNKRPDYIKAFWNVVNWDEVQLRLRKLA